MNYSVYDLITGEILFSVITPDPAVAELNRPEGAGLFEGIANDEDHYIDPATGERQNRLEMGLAWTVTGLQVEVLNVPLGSVLKVNGEEFTQEEEGPFVLNFEEIGRYRVSVENVPFYKPETIKLEIS